MAARPYPVHFSQRQLCISAIHLQAAEIWERIPRGFAAYAYFSFNSMNSTINDVS